MAMFTKFNPDTAAKGVTGNVQQMPQSSVNNVLGSLPPVDIAAQAGANASPVTDDNLARLAALRAAMQQGKPSGAVSQNPMETILAKYRGGTRGTV